MEKILRKTGINQSLRLLLIVASLVFGSNAWGQTEITWNSDKYWTGIGTTNISYTSGDFTISASRASGSASPTVNSKSYDFRTYAKNTFTVTSSNDNITRIVFFISTNGKKRWTDVAPNTGTTTVDKTAYTTSWEGDAKEITFTVGENATYGTDDSSKAGQFCIDKLVIYTSGGGGKKTATVTFAQESYSVQTNGKITVSATTSSSSPIVYSISPADGDVEIDENTGYIVAGATAGTYTITATVAENNDFTSASATCPLTVTAPAPPSYIVAAPTYYKKITSTDELAAGATYLIVCEEENCAIGSVSDDKGQPTTITYTTNSEKGINIISDVASAAEYLLEENSDGSFSLKNGTNYLRATSSSSTNLVNNTTANTNNEKWTFDFNDGNVELVSKVSTKRHLIYRASTYNVFGNYGTSSTGAEYKKVQLYQKVTDLAISRLTNGYATFVTDVPYVMPKGACGYAVTVAPQAGVITKTEAYTEGSQVPAQTALLIGGALGTNYYPAVLKENVVATYNGENYMEGARTAKGYTNTQKGVAVFYYKLALNRASKPGFYYGAADGAAFQLTKPTTAYLAVPQSITPVNGYLIDFDGEETGISTIAPTNGNADGAIYNLNGIRMAQPLRNLPKGVYIVNGKKVIK